MSLSHAESSMAYLLSCVLGDVIFLRLIYYFVVVVFQHREFGALCKTKFQRNLKLSNFGSIGYSTEFKVTAMNTVSIIPLSPTSKN